MSAILETWKLPPFAHVTVVRSGVWHRTDELGNGLRLQHIKPTQMRAESAGKQPRRHQVLSEGGICGRRPTKRVLFQGRAMARRDFTSTNFETTRRANVLQVVIMGILQREWHQRTK